MPQPSGEEASDFHAPPAGDSRIRLLFICSRNRWRSPTAELLFKGHPHIQARSAGVSRSAVHQVTARDLEWADVVCVMESEHKKRLIEDHGNLARRKHLHVLDIPDDYEFNDPVLVQLLQQTLTPLVSHWVPIDWAAPPHDAHS